jgi:hypothetical protein
MDYDADEEEEDELVGEYTHVTLQLLDLMHTLHTRAAGVHQVHSVHTRDLTAVRPPAHSTHQSSRSSAGT